MKLESLTDTFSSSGRNKENSLKIHIHVYVDIVICMYVHIFILQNMIKSYLFLFFIFLAAPKHMEFQIWAMVATYTTTAAMPEPLAHCATGPGIEPVS